MRRMSQAIFDGFRDSHARDPTSRPYPSLTEAGALHPGHGPEVAETATWCLASALSVQIAGSGRGSISTFYSGCPPFQQKGGEPLSAHPGAEFGFAAGLLRNTAA